MEELYESEVVWPDGREERPSDAGSRPCISSRGGRTWTASAPMDVPRTRRVPATGEASSCDYGDEERETEMVPPHVLASRGRMVGKAAFSVCTGQGRTLKGRDLRLVRNSVLRMTGFLED
ncbi:DUF584 domain containing protein [Musa troglodytarum]|uniref:DUF584 domain containing protein n=1 Tax=Musa troglodytarum TaxID=320322 RepID=A0A9E7EDI4_9LILI|nr:DUF584 domain containing protein [Musa troglodytarum]URD75249.1 DUF584 domain containing protein [Musa troglodytarum]